VIDDGDRHVDLTGRTESDVAAGLYFAMAMGWLRPDTPFTVRDVPA